MEIKDETMSASEAPKKRRTKAAAAAEPIEAEAETTKKPRRRAAKEEVEAATPEAVPEDAPKKRPRAKKADKPEAEAKEVEPRREEPAPEPRPEPRAEPRAEVRPEPKAEPRPEPVREAPAAESRPEPVRPEPVRDAPAAEARPESAPASEPRAQAPAPAAEANPNPQQNQGDQQRHGGRHDRNRQRHERHQHGGQHQHGQHPRGQNQPQGQQPPQGQQQPQGGATVAADGAPQAPQQGQQQQAQHQPGQPGQPGQGRRRRRRGRGGGGGGGQPQPGQAGQPAQNFEAQFTPVVGILEIDDRGFGKLRRPDKNFLASENDPDVPKPIIDRYRLRAGALVNAGVMNRNGKPTVQRVDLVEGVSVEDAQNRMSFGNLTVIDPERRIQLETTPGELLTRAIDIIAPIGFGQRGLIVAPPKTGKTIILQKIAKAVLTNHPKAKLMVLLIDERPEEVTDFRRSIGADVYASSSDRPAHEHLRIAEMVMERARRLVEAGHDVVVLLDSITRLARAYNKEIESSGRTMSGGVDSRALERPKRIFGAARTTEEAGSLTIIATALIDTGSRMDEVIFEEFKGTGNMEIVLDRQLAERRLFPAINVNNSGTRKEEKLFSPKENEKIRKLRAYLSALRPVEAMEKLLARLKDFKGNADFFDAL